MKEMLAADSPVQLRCDQMHRSNTMRSVNPPLLHPNILVWLLRLFAFGLAGCSVSSQGLEMERAPRLKPFPGYDALSPVERAMADHPAAP